MQEPRHIDLCIQSAQIPLSSFGNPFLIALSTSLLFQISASLSFVASPKTNSGTVSPIQPYGKLALQLNTTFPFEKGREYEFVLSLSDADPSAPPFKFKAILSIEDNYTSLIVGLSLRFAMAASAGLPDLLNDLKLELSDDYLKVVFLGNTKTLLV